LPGATPNRRAYVDLKELDEYPSFVIDEALRACDEDLRDLSRLTDEDRKRLVGWARLTVSTPLIRS
jgi:hypothetical protein